MHGGKGKACFIGFAGWTPLQSAYYRPTNYYTRIAVHPLKLDVIR